MYTQRASGHRGCLGGTQSLVGDMNYGVNSLNGAIFGTIQGSITGLIKGGSRSLNLSSYEGLDFPKMRSPLLRGFPYTLACGSFHEQGTPLQTPMIFTTILVMGTLKKGPVVLGNPNPHLPPHTPSFHFIF